MDTDNAVGTLEYWQKKATAAEAVAQNLSAPACQATMRDLAEFYRKIAKLTQKLSERA